MWPAFCAGVFTAGAVAPAVAVEAFSNWQFIHKSDSSCGYTRDHIDNVQYLGAATTKNTALESDGTCTGAVNNAAVAVGTGRLGVGVIVEDKTTGYNCGTTGDVYSTSTTSSISVTAYSYSNDSTHCPRHAGNAYSAFGCYKWDQSISNYRSASYNSPYLNFW